MGEAFGQVLPYAIGIAISPFPIVGVVLMLTTTNGRRNGLAFTAGWIVGLAVVGGVVLALAGDSAAGDDQSDTAGWISLAFGALLLHFALRQWRKRPKAGEPAETPKWMDGLDHFDIRRSAALGLGLAAINPKNLILVIGGAAAIAGTGAPSEDQIVAFALFVLVATLGTAVPVAMYLLMGERSEHALARLREWMVRNNAVVVAIICAVIAAKLIYDGVAGLT